MWATFETQDDFFIKQGCTVVGMNFLKRIKKSSPKC